ncbi:MAG: ABC transporter substrate-binding protein [Candidatus Heimdallarchaeota archaeon]
MNKKVKLSRIAAVTLVLSMFLLIPVCKTAGQIPKGGTFNAVLISEPRVVSPYTGSWTPGFVAGQIWNSLLAIDDNMEPTIPNLAKELPEINEAEGSYTFKLREGVKWHDGEEFNAEDVKFTFEQMAQYDIFSSLYFKDTVVEILDDYTVKITPGTFYPGIQMTLFGGLDTVIVPEHILGDNVEGYLDDTFRSGDPERTIGTGPFKFKEWVKGSHIVLERFDDFWGAPAPYLDEIVIKIIPEPSAVLAAFQTGEADYVFRGMPYEAYDTLVADENLNVYTNNRPPYKMVMPINTKHPVLSNVKVRQAMSYAIDRDSIVASATNGLGSVTDSYWTPDITTPSPDRTIYTYNPDKAKELLDEAGYPADASGVRAGLELEFLTRRGEPEEALAADIIEDDLEAVGFTIERKVVDFATMLELGSNFEFDFQLYKRWVMTFWTLQLFHSDWIIKGQYFANSIQYDNPDVDKAFDNWRLEADPVKQRQYLQEAEALISHDVPEILLYDVVFINVVRKTFKAVDGAKWGTLPDGRYVFWDSLHNMYWTEGEVPVNEFFTSLGLVGTAVVTASLALVIRQWRRKVN